jgi:DnaA-homolog protein
MSIQLPLGIGLPDSAVFATYHAGVNTQALAQLETSATGRGEPVLFIHGAAGTGKTHLLQAACAAATQAGQHAALLPLSESPALAPEMLDGWERFELVCVDDVGAIAGNAGWEAALFELYNALRHNGGHWIGADGDVPGALGLSLPDLVSRLGAGPVFRLHELDDDGRAQALQLRASQRGLDLPEAVAQYLLKHLPRDMGTLYDALAQLDAASMARQRRLTVPFVRETLELPR